MPPPTVEPLSPFQRILPPLTLHVIKSDAVSGMVGDLRAVILPTELKARLVWTAPDMGGKPVTKYELRYARRISDILDNFNSGTIWPYGSLFPLAPGSETTFTLEFTRNPSLLDQTLYFAIRGYSDLSDAARPGPVSNWVRVNVPSPPPPPPVSTTASTTLPVWPQQEESAVPNIVETFELNLEIILPVIIGILVLGIFVVIYCYFCLRKRAKKEAKPSHPEKPINGNISIVPTESNTNGSGSVTHQIASPNYGLSPQMTNLPQYEVRVEDEPNKRYSLTPYEGVMPNGTMSSPSYGGGNGNLSVINEFDQRTNSLVREKTLSPYQSWSASQLLHEHERRQSPYGQMEDYSQYYPPPVPPLPAYQTQDIYGGSPHLPPPNQFLSYQPSQNIYNPSIQGSISSVNSTDRKRRNVTMV